MSGKPNTSRRAFVLLLTLVLLMLAAVALVAVSRMSLQQALYAAEARSELQRRWAIQSCIQTLLPRAETLLALREEEITAAVPSMVMELVLSGQHCQLLIADEQAKANLNVIHQRRSREDLDEAVLRLIAASGSFAHPELRPTSDEVIRTLALPAFGALGQVFLRETPDAWVRLDVPEASAIADITIWGNGKLNIRRASPAAMLEIGKPVLSHGDITKLVGLRQRLPSADMDKLLSLLDLHEGKRSVLNDLLTDESRCHSIWVVLEHDNRAWYELAVLRQPEPKPSADTGESNAKDADSEVSRDAAGPELYRLIW